MTSILASSYVLLMTAKQPIALITDWGLALGLAALGQYELWIGALESNFQGPRWANSLFLLAISLPLLWRRRAPLLVIAAVVGSSALSLHAMYDLSRQPPIEPFLALLVAIYSLGSFASRRDAVFGASIATVGVLSFEMRGLLAGRPVEEVFPSLLFFVGAFTLGRILHARDRRAAALERRAAELEDARDEETERAIEEERSRIARELHDVIAHSLSVMVVQAAAERRALTGDQVSTGDVLLSIEQAGREALTELRRLLGILRKSGDTRTLEPQPGLGQLDNLIDQVRQAGLDVRIRLEGEATGLSPGLDLAAYRILQEALTNVLKHAGPCKTEIVVRYEPREVELEVINDGGGVRAAPANAGHGLIGMRERVSLYGGAFEAGPSEHDSYRVRAVLPLESGQE